MHLELVLIIALILQSFLAVPTIYLLCQSSELCQLCVTSVLTLDPILAVLMVCTKSSVMTTNSLREY